MVTVHRRVMRWLRMTVVRSMSFAALVGIGACAGEAPKGPSDPTADQVRSHADRAFEKLKQEERGRAAQPPTP